MWVYYCFYFFRKKNVPIKFSPYINTTHAVEYICIWYTRTKSRRDLKRGRQRVGGGTPSCRHHSRAMIGALLTSFRRDGVSLLPHRTPDGILSLQNKRALFCCGCALRRRRRRRRRGNSRARAIFYTRTTARLYTPRTRYIYIYIYI